MERKEEGNWKWHLSVEEEYRMWNSLLTRASNNFSFCLTLFFLALEDLG